MHHDEPGRAVLMHNPDFASYYYNAYKNYYIMHVASIISIVLAIMIVC